MLTSGGQRVADFPLVDPDHPDALKRAMHAIVGHSMQLLPFRAGNSIFKLTFSSQVRANIALGQPVRGVLWRVRQGSNNRQMVGMLDVNLLATETGRVLDVTVDLPYQTALIPQIVDPNRPTSAESVALDEHKQFAQEFDASLRRSIAQRCADWRRLVDASRCTVRSDDVYLPHYLRQVGYQFVFDVAARPDSGRVPSVAVTYSWLAGNGLPPLGYALKSAFIRQEALRLVTNPDTLVRSTAVRSWLLGGTMQRLIHFETNHTVRGSARPRTVRWYVPDRRDEVAPGVQHATSADLVVNAVRALDRAGRALGSRALPSSVVFAHPRNHATDVLSLNWDPTFGRNFVDGKLSSRSPAVLVLDQRLIRIPDALNTQKRMVIEVRNGVRLPSAALPVEETVAVLAWRRSMVSDRANATDNRQRLRTAIEALVGSRGVDVIDRPFDQTESVSDTQHRAAIAAEIGSLRAVRSVDAFGMQMFANWLHNPLASPQAEHLMSAMQLDQYRPELTL